MRLTGAFCESFSPHFTFSPSLSTSLFRHKLADGLLSGEYSQPRLDVEEHEAEGVTPSMFKAAVSQHHAEFASGRQQVGEQCEDKCFET